MTVLIVLSLCNLQFFLLFVNYSKPVLCLRFMTMIRCGLHSRYLYALNSIIKED